MARIGVLALQGDFAAHTASLREAGVDATEVRRTAQLRELAGLIIPGGESTTLLNLMRDEPWFERIRDFRADGGALFGTCAGAILLAREVVDPPQRSLGLIDVAIRRNAFGRQVDSFEAELELVGSNRPLTAAFIRAPRFVGLGPGVEVLARLDEEPVLVREGRVMAATFHTELAGDHRLHEIFLRLALGREIYEDETMRRPVADAISTGTAAQERRMSW